MYSMLGNPSEPCVARYLDDTANRKAARFLTKCRLGHVMLMDTVARMMKWPLSGGHCVLCGDGEVEDMHHFLIRCPALAVCRERMQSEPRSKLRFAAEAGAALWSDFTASDKAQLSPAGWKLGPPQLSGHCGQG